ncbi:hypothetical protein CR205_03505 [Alteribacter lacisalsi]|uniref:AlpA family phage regulatory protein n=1 Tax=Alteribacter lacisalsi TaxID=2045244 RepID=A0A2W0HKP8_9BACI|nr:hypothetical protein [Alteribacter lacisalsi]PYZ97672.1 hypothetical protein CR205_03505 [Alteribacter lacisalsi]
MRIVYGMDKLLTYLYQCELTVEKKEIAELIETKSFPHLRPFKDNLAFNLDHVDHWIQDQTEK